MQSAPNIPILTPFQIALTDPGMNACLDDAPLATYSPTSFKKLVPVKLVICASRSSNWN